MISKAQDEENLRARQAEKLEEIEKLVAQTKQIGATIGAELQEQGRTLDDLDSSMDKTTRIKAKTKDVQDIMQQNIAQVHYVLSNRATRLAL